MAFNYTVLKGDGVCHSQVRWRFVFGAMINQDQWEWLAIDSILSRWYTICLANMDHHGSGPFGPKPRLRSPLEIVVLVDQKSSPDWLFKNFCGESLTLKLLVKLTVFPQAIFWAMKLLPYVYAHVNIYIYIHISYIFGFPQKIGNFETGMAFSMRRCDVFFSIQFCLKKKTLVFPVNSSHRGSVCV